MFILLVYKTKRTLSGLITDRINEYESKSFIKFYLLFKIREILMPIIIEGIIKYIIIDNLPLVLLLLNKICEDVSNSLNHINYTNVSMDRILRILYL